MNIVTLQEEEMYRVVGEAHNPPVVRNQKEQNVFQAEIRTVYEKLVECLSQFGEEGDYYGMSDFAVRPDLRERPTVIPPPASHARQFAVTILTEKFFRSHYLDALHKFLLAEAPGYRIWIDQDFDPNWTQRLFLTDSLAKVYCTNSDETTRVHHILSNL